MLIDGHFVLVIGVTDTFLDMCAKQSREWYHSATFSFFDLVPYIYQFVEFKPYARHEGDVYEGTNTGLYSTRPSHPTIFDFIPFVKIAHIADTWVAIDSVHPKEFIRNDNILPWEEDKFTRISRLL